MPRLEFDDDFLNEYEDVDFDGIDDDDLLGAFGDCDEDDPALTEEFSL